MTKKLIADEIDERRFGQEAEVRVEARNYFSGCGGLIVSDEIVIAASRICFGAAEGEGERLFFKHLLLKKLDDYFSRTGRYTFRHISRPLGSVSRDGARMEAYFYEWVDGQDCFLWEYQEEGPVELDEWSAFVNSFQISGIAVNQDVIQHDNGRMSQNIVHQMPRTGKTKLNRCWKRIDFGASSLNIDYEKLHDYLSKNAVVLKKVLTADRLKLMMLAHKFLAGGRLGSKESKALGKLTCDYRLSTLRHLGSKLMTE